MKQRLVKRSTWLLFWSIDGMHIQVDHKKHPNIVWFREGFNEFDI